VRIRSRPLCAAALGLLLAAVPARAAAAQPPDVIVPGRAMDETGRAAAGLGVLLHRVTPSGGELLAETVTDADGRFELRGAGSTDPNAVYFVAARYRGELYIGPLLRPPFPTASDYVLEVGLPGGGVSTLLGGPGAPRATTLPGSAAGSPRRWLLALVPVLGLAGLAGALVARRHRAPAERRLLLEIARLDEAWDAGDDEAPADERAYAARRSRLIHELHAARSR
jgi:hypothetical protein